jgi:hypothetical protein
MGTGGAARILRHAIVTATVAMLFVAMTAFPGAKPAPKAFRATFFGISAGSDMTQLSDAVLTKELNLMQRAGVHWLRVAIPWSRVHHIKDYPEKWTLIDRLIAGAASRNMQVVGIADNPPDWAKQRIPAIPCTVQPPFNLTAYAAFVGDLARRYPATVLSAIELENSPNLAGTWPHPDPCAYAYLMKKAYPAIKNANPAVKVLNGGVGGTRSDATHIPGDVFFAELYKNGAKGNFDVASFHPYSYPCFPSKTCSTDRTWYHVPAVRETMVANGDGAKKIWATEFGSPTNGTATDGHVTEQQQAAIMVDGMQEWRKLTYGGPFFVFNFSDNGTDPAQKNDWFGLVSNDLSYHKPAYTAYRDLAT